MVFCLPSLSGVVSTRPRKTGIAAAASIIGMFAASLFFEPAPALAQETLETRVLVTTRERAVLSGELAARIEQIAVRPGAPFKKGDLLIAFDCVAYKAQRATVAADLHRTDAQLKSQQRLFELRSVGELDVIMAEAARDSARAQLQLRDVYLDRCKINAPYDGVVVEWRSQPYQIANPGDELVEIIGSGNLELELIVPSQWLSWLTIGEPFQARIDETGSIITAKTERIGADIDPVSQTVKVFATIDKKEGKLLSGMSGVALFDSKP